MANASSTLARLLAEGRLILDEHPPAEDPELRAVLDGAFARYRLTLAGPAVDWSPQIGLGATAFLLRAAWFLQDRSLPGDQLKKALDFPHRPDSAAAHLSADLLFRYLPAILRRARAGAAGDVLVGILTDVLRRWPLSGVLAELPGKPTSPLDFAGHPGLQLLYAERLAEHFNPGWLPAPRDRAYLELVWHELGKDPALLAEPSPHSVEEDRT